MAILSKALALLLTLQTISAYKLVHKFDHTNWYDDSFVWKTVRFYYTLIPASQSNNPQVDDPTEGTVDYKSLPEAQKLGLTKIQNDQVYSKSPL